MDVKLIDILVQELPKLGGWPDGAVECVRYVDEATIDFYDEHGNWPDDCSLTYGPIAKAICITPTEPCQRETVKFSEYETALAASKAEWDGEGLPPVGVEFEHSFHADGFFSWHWRRCTAVGKHGVLCVDEKDTELYLNDKNNRFRPIRSEDDKKRAECVIALSRIDPQAMPFEYGDKHSDGSLIGPFWYELYDAIAAGKIPHIRID